MCAAADVVETGFSDACATDLWSCLLHCDRLLRVSQCTFGALLSCCSFPKGTGSLGSVASCSTECTLVGVINMTFIGLDDCWEV